MRLIKLQSEERSRLHQRLLRRIELSHQRMQTCQCFIPENIQVVGFGFVGEERPVVFHSAGFFAERGCCVLKLGFKFKDVLADLRQDCALKRSLTLSHTLATCGLETGLTERM